ncbi:MAG: B12-binding domain-containing radical SAM protein [Clostridiales bacterium]|jgi:radical SAM superfamily enzyme YgiQ (UPF0313 family)|nr:B12-binding domain-containing radical SAM protein [Clostridiales bacterium]
MKKITILAINARHIHSSLAVWLLAQGVAQFARRKHDVRVVEANINQSDDEIADAAAARSPDVIGISAYIWNAAKLPNIMKILRRRLPGAVIVLGGPEASHNADFWLKKGADFVLSGEGERKFAALLDELAGCKPLNDAPAADFVDPFTEDCIAALKGKIAYIESSRGCPFSCAFCLSGGDAVRFFPLDAVKKQLDKLAAADVRIIKFVDRTFNANAARAYELIEYIISLDTPNSFHFEAAADLFDAPTLELLATAPPGKIQLEAGLQSFFAPALAAVARQSDLAKAVENLRKLILTGNIHIHVDLIAGLPHETLADFMDSFDAAYSLGAHTLQLGFLKMLHGSAMRENEKSIIFAQQPPYEIISSPWMGAADLDILRLTENALQNTYNKGRFLRTLQYVLPASGLRPFALYRALGQAAPKNRMPLEIYAEKIYGFCVKLPGVAPDLLLGHMICDWMGMVKGVNMPIFMKIGGRQQLDMVKRAAEETFGRKIRRNEAAILPSGKGVFVDSESRDPVTGLYKLHFH